METKNSYKVLKDRIIIMRPQRSHRGEGVEQFRNTEVELAREKKQGVLGDGVDVQMKVRSTARPKGQEGQAILEKDSWLLSLTLRLSGLNPKHRHMMTWEWHSTVKYLSWDSLTNF